MRCKVGMLPFVFAALVASSGCSSKGSPSGAQSPGLDAGDGVDGAVRASCDAAAVKTCLVTQKACALASGQPSCVACPSGNYADKTGACQPLPGAPLAHTFADFTSNPGQEILGLCQSWTLNNETDIWVNAVELEQNEASHHSNWIFSPEGKYPGADGVWPCSDRGYDQTMAAISGGVLYAQSTQAAHEVQKLPDGAAVRLPPHTRIIGDVHILNAGAAPITGHASLTLHAIDAGAVLHKLTAVHMTYGDLQIPPHATSRFTGTCNLADDYLKFTGKPLDSKIYYVLPHTHKMGTRFFVSVLGGPENGKSIIDVPGFNGEARGRAYDPPVDLTGALGMTFGCEYNNTRDTAIHWGFGDQEMCEFLGFIESAAIMETRVGQTVSAGADGTTQLFTGTCSNLVIGL